MSQTTEATTITYKQQIERHTFQLVPPTKGINGKTYIAEHSCTECPATLESIHRDVSGSLIKAVIRDSQGTHLYRKRKASHQYPQQCDSIVYDFGWEARLA